MAQTLAQAEKAFRVYQDGINEGGDGYNPNTETVRRLRAEQDARQEAAYDAALAIAQTATEAEWTVEVTQARRGIWNTWCRAQGKTIKPLQVQGFIDTNGYGPLDIAAAKRRHGIA